VDPYVGLKFFSLVDQGGFANQGIENHGVQG
jgi:hypothetical protein